MIGANAFFFSRRNQFVELAARCSIPTICYPWREAVVGGGLVSYGASVTDAYALAGSYIGRILKGEKAADLPGQQSSNTELVINLKTAKTLGIAFPQSLLGRADVGDRIISRLPLLAHLRHDAMSDLSLLSGVKRKSD